MIEYGSDYEGADYEFYDFAVIHYHITPISVDEMRWRRKGERHMTASGDASDQHSIQYIFERKKRKDAGKARWQGRDYYALQWIGEQGVIRFDQLQRLLGRESPNTQDDNAVLSPSATRNALDRWEGKRFINSAHIVPGEPTYYWLSTAGFQFVELDLPHYNPKKMDMPTLLAHNQARLHMELLNRTHPHLFGSHQECYWVSNRTLLSDNPGRTKHTPSGEYRTELQGTLAIEVVIARNDGVEQQMRDYVQGNLGTYSGVWYFVLSDLYPSLHETCEKLKASGLDISKLTLFNADTILLPSRSPKRTKKKKG